MDPVFESREIRRLRPWLPTRVAPGVLMLAFALVMLVARYAHVSLVTPFALMVALLATFGASMAPRRSEPGTLRVDAAGLHWNGKLVAPRGRIPRGTLRPETPQGPVVVLDGSGLRGPQEFVVRHAAEGREVLQALGLDASQVTAAFRGKSPLAGQPYLPLLVPFFLMGSILFRGVFSPLVLACVLPVLLALLVWPSRVVVGTDGVLVQWLFSRRFVPLREIGWVRVVDAGVELVRADGSKVLLPVGPIQLNRQQTERQRAQLLAERDALAERIRDAMEAAPGAAPVLEHAMLARGGRTAGEWLEALRALAGRAEGGMRAAPVLPEQLWACVNDPNAEPTVRAGAAAALANGASAEAKERLRVAAQSVAQPKLRVVLEAAAEGGEEELTEALAGVEDEQGGKRRAG